MSDSGEKGHWSESSGEKGDSAEGGEDQTMDTRNPGDEEEGEDGEEEEDDVDSATYEAELEQEIDEAEVQEEVDKLQEESECPIEELIALYGLPAGSAAASAAPTAPAAPAAAAAAAASPGGRRTRARRRAPPSEPERGPPPPSRRRLDSCGMATASGNTDEEAAVEPGPSGAEGGAPAEEDDEDERLYSRMFAHNSPVSYSSVFSGGEAEDDDDNDEDFDPGLPLDEKKIVQIGDAHQAHVPTGLSPYPELERHKHDLTMVWDPNRLGADSVERYLSRMYKDDLGQPDEPTGTGLGSGSSAVSSRSEASKHRVPDDENLLFLLQRCNYDMSEAFRRRKCQNIDERAFPDYMSLWTEEEVTNFERGILHYGKNFHLIHAHKVCKRDVPQLVEFYYWWKKSARYENFVRAFKLDRRVPTQSSGAGLGSAGGQAGLEACPEEEEGQTDGVLPHLNGSAGLAGESGEFMECLVDEQEFISGNYEESAAAASSPSQSGVLSNADAATGDLDKNSAASDQPAFKPWDQHREKFDYEMPRRAACTVPRQKSPSKGSSRPKRASIMACL